MKDRLLFLHDYILVTLINNCLLVEKAALFKFDLMTFLISYFIKRLREINLRIIINLARF